MFTRISACLACFALAFLLSLPSIAQTDAQPSPVAQLGWQKGPGEGSIGGKATIQIPAGYRFLGAEETKKFMALTQNFSNGREFLFAPDSMDWFAVFEFSDVGYVKDDETLDADKVLDSVKKGTEKGNEERRNRGWSTMTVEGWRFKPQYDKSNKLLEWAFIAKDDKSNEKLINYNTRLLGRTGVMEVVLVTDPAILDESVADLKARLANYDFASGQKYSEYKEGDRVAQFGLAALVAGGAAAIATKKGFFSTILAALAAGWKIVVGVVIAGIAWLGSIFRKKQD